MIEYTPRGFVVYDRFKDTYGCEIIVQESSSAEEKAVWIFTNRNGEVTAPHLNVEQTKRLRDALDEFIKHFE